MMLACPASCLKDRIIGPITVEDSSDGGKPGTFEKQEQRQ